MLQIGQLLFTRDGRKYGNGIIEGFVMKNQAYWRVETADGIGTLTENEIETYWFTVDAIGEVKTMSLEGWRAQTESGRMQVAEQTAINLRQHLEQIRDTLGEFYTGDADVVGAIMKLKRHAEASKRSQRDVEEKTAAMLRDLTRSTKSDAKEVDRLNNTVVELSKLIHDLHIERKQGDKKIEALSSCNRNLLIGFAKLIVEREEADGTAIPDWIKSIPQI